MSARMIQNRLASGVLVGRAHGVYAFAAVPNSWEQDLMVASLQAGPEAAISHRPAARLWNLPGFDSSIVEITSPRRITNSKATVHRSTVPTQHVRRVHGIPTTDPTRTLCDMGAVAPVERVEAALDASLAKGLTSHAYLMRRLEQYGGKGVRGTRTLRRILDSRDPSNLPTESELESRFVSLLRRSRLPLPLQQRPIYKDGSFVGRVDFVYPQHDLIVEADSVTWHFSRRAWEDDLERRNRLTLGGWRILHITWFQITSAPKATARRVRGALSLADQLPLR